MKKLFQTTIAFFAVLLTSHGQPGSPDGLTYKTGWMATRKLGLDLHGSLKQKQKNFVHVEPIAMETEVMPFVKLTTFDENINSQGMLFVSIGFVDLMNNVAHAKAIDKIQKGYFQNYILSLSQETGDKSLAELPNLNNQRYWSEDMLNEQLSNFNQMVGTICALKLTHFYLGHYKKYAAKLEPTPGKRVSINDLLTPQEWEESLKVGIQSALDCGFGTDGIISLFEAIEKMQTRPEWTVYFLPRTSNVTKMKKQLKKWETDYFGGN